MLLMIKSLFFVLFACLEGVIASDRPIIGILAQEIELNDPNKDLNYTSYLPASYVKAVESSGGRVVPIFIRRDVEYYKDMAKKLNGFLFTGGSADLMYHYGVARSGKFILEEVLKMNGQETHVPLLGVCQGMELLAILSNGWNPILTQCFVENQPLSLKLVPGSQNSSLYRTASTDDINTLIHLRSTANYHQYCLTQKNLTRYNLTQWNVLSTSISNKGFVFISSMEWKGLPISAIQFHPEKLSFEWNPKQLNPHNAKSISAARIFYDWLVAQSRLNDNRFNDPKEEVEALIYNYNPIYTGKENLDNEQIYYFIDQPGVLENSVHSPLKI